MISKAVILNTSELEVLVREATNSEQRPADKELYDKITNVTYSDT